MEDIELRQQVELACRHLLSEQDRDPYTPTYGCFDRRYWGWKLVDSPEATFQRNVYPLAWLLSGQATSGGLRDILHDAVQAGLQFATHIQHKDGSFDQAFPNEHSFGATAFLLHPLLEAYQVIRDSCDPSIRESVEQSLQHAADFLCRHNEVHGHLANHVAGAVLSLLVSARFFGTPRYAQRAAALLERILAHQSAEGWFLEYEGADPGYQTLCLYYLAQVYQLQPDSTLRVALEKAIDFLSWFVHPDGTFGGEYGSRRTAVFYPGGLALLSRDFPLAESITRFMLQAITAGRTVTLGDVDIGNFAPLLANYVTVLDIDVPDGKQPPPPLPWEKGGIHKDFEEAGLYIRGTHRYYAIVGASNGGVVKVFDRQRRKLLWNDGGYVGQFDRGAYITTQMTDKDRSCQATLTKITVTAPFYYMLRSAPTPFKFILLRLLNLTIMRSVLLGNWLKKLLVRLLISGKRTAPLTLSRTVQCEDEQVILTDVLRSTGRIALRWLECGRPFVAIHMASARYFEGFLSFPVSGIQPCKVDVATLGVNGEVQKQVRI